jgi:hypothetical protein
MKTPRPSDEKAGSVLVFGLLILAVGALVLGGIAQLAATQSLKADEEWTAMRRQVLLGNSRAMARQYLQSQMFFGGALAASNSNAFGGFILPTPSVTNGWWATVSETNPNARLNINPFTVMERGGFYRVWVPGTLWNGREDVGWNFQIRTRSPVAAGYSFVRQRPSVAAVGELAFPPYIDMQNATNFFGFPGLPRLRVSSVTNTNASDTNGFVGFMDVPVGASEAGPFTNVSFLPFQTNTNMQAVVNLVPDDIFATNSVLRYDVPTAVLWTNGTNPAVSLPVRRVVLVGSPTGDADRPIHVVVNTNNTNVTALVLSNNNLRRVYFNMMRPVGYTNAAPFDVASAGNTWRLGITVSRQRIQFQVGSLTIIGGLRTDGGTDFQAGNAFFTPETDPRGLDFIGDRMMWLEDTRSL